MIFLYWTSAIMAGIFFVAGAQTVVERGSADVDFFDYLALTISGAASVLLLWVACARTFGWGF